MGPVLGVIVVGGTIALIATAPKPQPVQGNLGRMDLP
jgi:hypothetical protein